MEAVREGGALTWRRITSRHGWTIGVLLLLALIVPYWRSLSQQEAQFDLQALAIDVLPFALAAMAQAVVVISGGIDLSVGALMSVINVLSAEYMVDMSFRGALLYALALVALGALMGAFTGRDRGLTHSGHRRHPRDAVRLGRRRAPHPRDPGWRRAAGLPRSRSRHGRDALAADAVSRPRGRLRARLAAAATLTVRARALRGGLAQRRVSQRRERRLGARQCVRAERRLRSSAASPSRRPRGSATRTRARSTP